MKKVSPKQVLNLVADDKLEKAIQELLVFFGDHTDVNQRKDAREYFSDLVLLSGRLKNVNQQSSLGILDSREALLEKNNLNYAFIQLVNRIPDNLWNPLEETIPGPSGQVVNDLLFYEDFNDNRNNWAVSEETVEWGQSDAVLHIRNGQYIFEHNRTNGSWFTWISKKLNAEHNYSIETNVTYLGGTDNNGFGLTFGMKNTDNCYTFVISANGYFHFGGFINGEWKDIHDWTSSPHINQGVLPNHLKVEKNSKGLQFLINNNLVYTHPFLPLFGEHIGFTIFWNIKVAFNDLMIKNWR